MRLVSAEAALALDREASASWGLDPFALVEAAGRACAELLVSCLGNSSVPFGVLVLAGPGNNGADALVALRVLAGKGFAAETKSAALLGRDIRNDEHNPRSQSVAALRAMGIPAYVWEDAEQRDTLLKNADIVIDGLAGTGLTGPLRGVSLEMAEALNNLPSGGGKKKRLVVSIDIPSGAYGGFVPASPVVQADITLALEPLKQALYTPALRSFCGTILPVTGIFPRKLLARYGGAELFAWSEASVLIPPVPPDAHKYGRGLVEIHAGARGSCGAARIAAKGAAAAGAGLVRLIVDDELYPPLASDSDGVMAAPESEAGICGTDGRFKPDALLLGPGWGRDEKRFAALEKALEAEERGIPLILDADALFLVKKYFKRTGKEIRFHGRTLLTPHAGELEAFSGIEKEKLLSDPALIAALARSLNAAILFKSHVMILARPSGDLAFTDGMLPVLAAGGSGDLLAGFCAALAARSGDICTAALASASLLIESGRGRGRVFCDPVELASFAAGLAGNAWLYGAEYG